MPKLLSVRDVAEILNRHQITIYKDIEKGVAPPHVRIGRSIRFRPEDVERFLEQHVVAVGR